MECIERDGELELILDDDFDLKKTFDCGQCFRWNENGDGSYTGVAMGKAARIRRDGRSVFITGTAEDFQNVWLHYFDLERDYRVLRKSVCIDSYMKAASDFGAGIRILNQDRWETLCSFIISQCNNIPRIKKIVETMSRLFGDEVYLNGERFYTFPPAQRIAELEIRDLEPLRSGYRAPYILNAARMVADGSLNLEELSGADIGEARRVLKALPGIGDKVANCVILFSLRIPEAFPIDVWMKKAISEHYPNGLDPTVFGKNAGLAQQYMFYFQRSGEALTA